MRRHPDRSARSVARGDRPRLPAFLLAAALAMVAAVDATAQNPQEGWRPSAEEARGEYYAYVIRSITDQLGEWRADWEADDLDDLTRRYTQNGVLYLPGNGNPIRGRDALRTEFARLLPSVGSIDLGMAEFDASGGMAYIAGRISYRIDDGADGHRVRGGHVTILVREGRTWRIRFQHLFESDDQGLTPAGAIGAGS